MVHMPWKDVANTDDTPFIVVTTEGMDDIAHGSHGWGSWNVSNSEVIEDCPVCQNEIAFSGPTRPDL